VALLRKTNDSGGEAAALEDLLTYDYTNLDAARELVSLLGAPADAARALKVHRRIAELDPFDSASSSALGRDALAAGDAAGAARWFRAALATGPRDPVGARCDLADAYLRLGNAADAKHETLAALEIAPTYPRAQDLLLSIVEAHP
jgi:Flp pilus assembly protein TadD